MPNNSLLDQVVIVTGAAGGIGSAIARVFNQSGARMVLADYDHHSVSRLATSLDPSAERVIAIRYDASNPSDADAVVSACLAQFQCIDHVVPAAGIYDEQPVSTLTDVDWRRTISINLDGVFYICRRAIPHMRAGGTIVTIASGAAHQGCSPGGHYAASKGAVLALSRSLAKELAPAIRVNTVSPGTINTPMIEDLLRQNGDKFLDATPAGRVGSAEEVANVVAFLCSSASSYIVGEAIHVNGGYYMG
ncbi:short-chain dehydrogenase [Mesorhizobium amorphae]|uniref:SDR family NAD(P)-dependent oxidoreductase n=1 Tax=Mesorhizobium amorphae TaxID=71433 RepID=UPI00235C9A9E|nr:short-chain dehydrogenase [Mesorhizobium amorphae]